MTSPPRLSKEGRPDEPVLAPPHGVRSLSNAPAPRPPAEGRPPPGGLGPRRAAAHGHHDGDDRPPRDDPDEWDDPEAEPRPARRPGLAAVSLPLRRPLRARHHIRRAEQRLRHGP